MTKTCKGGWDSTFTRSIITPECGENMMKNVNHMDILFEKMWRKLPMRKEKQGCLIPMAEQIPHHVYGIEYSF